MQCIIIGAGKVGYSIAATLSTEGHEVTVIDINLGRLTTLEEHLDVHVLEGNGAQVDVLLNAGANSADLLVAVTEMDELNMVSCFIAKSLGVKNTVARVRNPGYSKIDSFDQQLSMGIDLIINPEKVTAQEILKLIQFPETHNVVYYANKQVQLLELQIPVNCPVAGQSLDSYKFPHPCMIIAISRNDNLIIPRGRDELLPGDSIFMMGATGDMLDLELFLGISRGRIDNIAILGGRLLGYYLANLLENEKKKYNIKIIESNIDICDELADTLHDTLIINGSGTDMQLLEDENVGGMDLFVAVTDDDKENLLASILAKNLGAKKTIAQIRRSDFVNMMERVGIDCAVSPRNLMVADILKFIGRKYILSVTFLSHDMAQITELIIPEKAKVAGKSIKELNFPQGAVIGMIIRDDKAIVAKGNDLLQGGDRVLVFALSKFVKKVEDFLTAK